MPVVSRYVFHHAVMHAARGISFVSLYLIDAPHAARDARFRVEVHVGRSQVGERHERAVPDERTALQLHDAEELPRADQVVPEPAVDEALGAAEQHEPAGERPGETEEHRLAGESWATGAAGGASGQEGLVMYPYHCHSQHYLQCSGVVRMRSVAGTNIGSPA